MAAAEMTAGDAPDDLPALRLREPLPEVVDSAVGLRSAIERVVRGSGPVAIDAERASGYRYSSRAYLVQLRRAGTGTVLVDPVGVADLGELDAAIGDTEWILHAATQDLPCLREVGMQPRQLFDTELAGRLLNLPRVGLATLTRELLGYSLAKEHSAVDWSTRPLPRPWLEYAALDVEPLLELRDALTERLLAADKLSWAVEEFAALTTYAGPPPRIEPWRRVSGVHRVRGRRGLAVVRALWEARDELAAASDAAPGRVLSDAAIVEAASETPRGRALRSLPTLRARPARRNLDRWSSTVATALALPEAELPRATARDDGPPPPRVWPDRNPEAAVRLTACRDALRTIAERVDVPLENLLAPDSVRRLAWEPPPAPTRELVAGTLTSLGARGWQLDLTADALAAALAAGTSSPEML